MRISHAWIYQHILAENSAGGDLHLQLRCQSKILTREGTQEALQQLRQVWKARGHTITSDNGKEFAQFQRIGDALKAVMYFAHPYASWERGTNENTNGLIRQHFPKDKGLSNITREDIEWAERRLNNRPRKYLGFKTPNEVFYGAYSPVALGS